MLHSEASICKSLNWLAASAPRNLLHCRLSSRPRPVPPARPKERFSRGDFHAVPALVSTLRSRSSPLFGVPYNTYYIIGAQKAASSGRSRRSLRVRPRRGQNGAPFPFRCIQRPGTCFTGFSARAHRSHRFRDTRRGPCWPRCARPSHPGRPPAGGRRSLPQWATRYRNAQPPAG